jgi:hypothetical protein
LVSKKKKIKGWGEVEGKEEERGERGRVIVRAVVASHKP